MTIRTPPGERQNLANGALSFEAQNQQLMAQNLKLMERLRTLEIQQAADQPGSIQQQQAEKQ